MPDENPVHNFICLPYLNLGNLEKVDLGFAKIWNFSLKAEEFIPDTPLREQVARTLKNYRMPHAFSHGGADPYPSIRGVGVIDVGVDSKVVLDKEAKQRANDARLMLFISFLSRNNTLPRNMNSGHSMASSENFATTHFSMVVGSQHITEMGGFVVPSWHGGIDIDKNMVIRPRYVQTPQFRVEEELLESLVSLRLKKKRVFRRVMSAIEVFYESYYNSPEVSHNARILLQASAFEILLDTGQAARKEVKDFLKKTLNYEDKILSFKSERKGGGLVGEKGTIREKWADRFFTLRNHIIHGYVPKEGEYLFGDWQSHFDIALYFFIFCLKRKIEESLSKNLFDDDVEWKSWTDDLQIPAKTYTGFEYEHFGRRGWERRIKRLRP